MSEDTTEVANPQDQSHERTPLLVESRKDSISARGSVKSSSDPTIHVGEDVECNAPKANGEDEAEAESQGGSIAGLISILLLGVFVSNADGSIVLATYGIITSEFNELSESGWLVTSFVLGMCATMPLVRGPFPFPIILLQSIGC
ncbi:MAG: hypothetical protein M1819_000522 [Sarea resinae]|nr:MAG: hypothetical protein M1819_000522 [Sarea resinae]